MVIASTLIPTDHEERRHRPYGGRIVVVSSSRDESDRYAEMLRAAGFCALQTQSAAEAYGVALDVIVSAVIIGASLGGNESADGLTARKSNGRFKTLPILTLSSADRGVDQIADGHSCDLIASKPCVPDVLASVNALLSARGASSRSVAAIERIDGS
jgi:DNA-binding response OmpR family regulator